MTVVAVLCHVRLCGHRGRVNAPLGLDFLVGNLYDLLALTALSEVACLARTAKAAVSPWTVISS